MPCVCVLCARSYSGQFQPTGKSTLSVIHSIPDLISNPRKWLLDPSASKDPRDWASMSTGEGFFGVFSKDMAREYEKMRRFNTSHRNNPRPYTGVHLSEIEARPVHTTKGKGEMEATCGHLRSSWRPSVFHGSTASSNPLQLLASRNVEQLQAQTQGDENANRHTSSPHTHWSPRRVLRTYFPESLLGTARASGYDGTAPVLSETVPISSSNVYYENEMGPEFRRANVLTLRSGFEGHRSPVQTSAIIGHQAHTGGKTENRFSMTRFGRGTRCLETPYMSAQILRTKGGSVNETMQGRLGESGGLAELAASNTRTVTGPARAAAQIRRLTLREARAGFTQQEQTESASMQSLQEMKDDPFRGYYEAVDACNSVERGEIKRARSSAWRTIVVPQHDEWRVTEAAPGKSQRGVGIPGYKGVRPISQRREEDRPLETDVDREMQAEWERLQEREWERERERKRDTNQELGWDDESWGEGVSSRGSSRGRCVLLYLCTCVIIIHARASQGRTCS